jgi:nucleoside-diphosphate-sugar epimerase
MSKNILIIGYGDLGRRVKSRLDHKYIVYALNRNPKKEDGVKSFYWDWTSGNDFNFKGIIFDSIILIPKPSNMNEDGYRSGFIQALVNINNSLLKVDFNKLIAISSTRVYGSEQHGMLNENIELLPSDFRGSIIKDYEKLLTKTYQKKLIILRFAGLYDENSKTKPFNGLHRKNAAMAINFFVKNENIDIDEHIFNCCEDVVFDDSKKCISNKRIKETGFSFEI